MKYGLLETLKESHGTRSNERTSRELLQARVRICWACTAMRDGPEPVEGCKSCRPSKICSLDGDEIGTHAKLGACNKGKLQPPRPTVLDFNLSDRCNLSCSMCYAKEGGGAGPDLERTKTSLRWFVEQARPRENVKRRTFNVYGGEPLVEWDDLQATVEWAAETWPEYELGFTIVTNLTLLTEDRLD